MRNFQLASLSFVILAAVVASSGAAHAQSHEGDLRLGLKGAFGFGGEGSSEVEGNYYGELEDDLETTVGFGLFGFYPLHRYFHIGLQTTFGWSQNDAADDAGADSTFFMDLSPVLKARVPLLADKLELYLQVPVGLSITVPGDDRVYGLGEIDTGVGWNIGVQAGVSYFAFDDFALMFELGWQGRGSTNGSQAGLDVSASTSQFALNFGLAYAF